MVQTLEAQGQVLATRSMVNLEYVPVVENTNSEVNYVDIHKFTADS